MRECPHCQSNQTKKVKVRNNKQQYQCMDCSSYYSVPLASPLSDPIQGQQLDRLTTQVNAEGEVIRQWIKTKQDTKELLAAQRAAIEALTEQIEPIKPNQSNPVSDSKLANLYTITDAHIGMMANASEGGESWSTEKGEHVLINTFCEMVNQSPPAQLGIINQLGDFTHSDGILPVTPSSGHVLDQDVRFREMIKTAIRVIDAMVAKALEKHPKVLLILAQGNHDEITSMWLQELYAARYALEPRIEVDTTCSPYYGYLWGFNLLGFHHGHKKKPEALPLLFAQEYRDYWGQAKRTYIHSGHTHHHTVKEYSGAQVEVHPTIVARDAYASSNGYHSMRRAASITYHKEYGEVGRTLIWPEMLAA